MSDCPPSALDEAERAIAHGYSFEEVVVIIAPDGVKWWDWKSLPRSRQELFHQCRRANCWMTVQVFQTGDPSRQAAFSVVYYPTEALN